MKLTATQQRMNDLIHSGAEITNRAGQKGVNLSSVHALYNRGLIGFNRETGLYTTDTTQRMH